MSSKPDRSVTQELLDLTAGGGVPDRGRCDALVQRIYPEMRRIADRLMRSERSDHTLQPTALVHEAYIRLVDRSQVQWTDRAHFLGLAARVMRRILIDHARERGAAKRGGGRERVTLDEGLAVSDPRPTFDALAFDEALTALAAQDPRAAQVAELRLLGGLTTRETSAALGIATRTVEKDWAMARLWLARALDESEAT